MGQVQYTASINIIVIINIHYLDKKKTFKDTDKLYA